MKRALAVLFLLSSIAGCKHTIPYDNGRHSGACQGSVRLEAPRSAMYVGSYARIPVQLDGEARFEDLTFEVPEGPRGGTVSESRSTTFDPKQPDVMLIAGPRPGHYTLEARSKREPCVVARVPFEVTVKAPRGKLGPSFVTQGIGPIPSAAPAWGGGPGGRQNVNTNLQTGTRRIALIFVDTNEQRYTADAATLDTFRARWRNNIRDGITSGGITRSLRRFYQETSNGRLDVSIDLFGPYQLDGNWDEVGAGAGWQAHAQAAITAADDDIDYNNYDTVLVVSQSVGAIGDPAAKMAWPTATIGEWNGWSAADGYPWLGTIQMPNDWTERDGRQIYATASHEMGHNLGLGDQYAPSVTGRNAGDWEIMAFERNLPNFSLAHKMRLGWVDEAWVRGFNFATMTTPVDQTVTLSPVTSGAPAAGRFAGIEVRVADGLNYYFEYRKNNAAQIADAVLPTNDRIFGEDVRSDSFVSPFARPDLLLLSNDSDGDGAVLGNGANYRETDSGSPSFPVEFRADASNINGTTGDVRIRYGVNEKPDPSIRPWGAPPWQTVDIEVRNARSSTNPDWFNVPWQEHANDVVARIKNGGNVDAPGVLVNFFIKNYNIGGAPETILGSDTRDIPANTTVEFHTSWVPPSGGHYCVIVRIPLYIRPGPPVIAELTELNNSAQSNYDHFISPTASPAVRQVTDVEVGNPYDKPTRIYIAAGQNNPLYRTYLGHRWLDLAPHETRKVEIMYEYAGHPARLGKYASPQEERAAIERYAKLPNDVSLTSLIVDPNDPTGHHMLRLGGAGAKVTTGSATKIVDVKSGDGRVTGRVVTTAGKAVGGGTIILSMLDPKLTQGRSIDLTADVTANGFVFSNVPSDPRATLYYVPAPGFGQAEYGPFSMR